MDKQLVTLLFIAMSCLLFASLIFWLTGCKTVSHFQYKSQELVDAYYSDEFHLWSDGDGKVLEFNIIKGM